MKKILPWILGVVGLFLFIGLVIPIVPYLTNTYGKISFDGGVAQVRLESGDETWTINEEGTPLPYGVYIITLPDGRTINIFKNDRGNARISLKEGEISVDYDQNVLNVSY